MANINVRANEQTVELLKEIATQTGDSQAQVVEKSLKLYKDYLIIQERKRKEILEQM